MNTLTEALVSALVRAQGGRAAGPLGDVVARLCGDVTVVVAGRRGVGKTWVSDTLVHGRSRVRRYAVQHGHPTVWVMGSAQEPSVDAGLQVVRVTSAFLQGRRVVELPEVPADDLAQQVETLAMLEPDVVLYVTRTGLRADQRRFLETSVQGWGLSAADVAVVLVDPVRDRFPDERRRRLEPRRETLLDDARGLAGQVAVVDADDVTPVRVALAQTERLVAARRCTVAIERASELVTLGDLSGYPGLLDDLERITLSPQAHVLRERWAVNECATHPDQFPQDLVGCLRWLSLDEGDEPRGDNHIGALADLWRSRAADLEPRPAEVARIVAHSLHLRLADPAGVSGRRSEEVAHNVYA